MSVTDSQISIKFGAQLRLGPSRKTKYNISQRRRGLGHVIPRYTFNYISKTDKTREFKFGTHLHLSPSHKTEVQYFRKRAWPRSRDREEIWDILDYIDFRLGTQLSFVPSHKAGV